MAALQEGPRGSATPLFTPGRSGEPLAKLAFTMPPTPCDSYTRITPPCPPPATLCLSFHADAAKATRGKPEGILPFEVHHAFWDSRGGVEGWQEFLSQLDGLYPEHL